MLDVVRTGKFKKDFVLSERRGKNIDKLVEVMGIIIKEEPLPPERQNHPLHGKWEGTLECHVESDWLLIYEINSIAWEVIFHRTGSHSDLF